MKGKMLFILAILAIVGYVVFIQFGKPGGKADDQIAVRASLNALTKALAANNAKAAGKMVALSFSNKNKKIDRKFILKVFLIKRSSYLTKIKSVKVFGDNASVSYKRTEARGDGKQFSIDIKNESWIRDAVDKKSWRLNKLADNDKWFRSLKGPARVKEEKPAETKTVIETLLKKTRGRGMKPGERYTQVNKRDPFRSLLITDPGLGGPISDLCEPDRPREFLEAFELRSLKLSGIILSGDESSVALMEIPDGKGYTVRKGRYIGKNCGEIKEIWGDYMLVEEKIQKPGEAPGTFEIIETSVKLRPEEG